MFNKQVISLKKISTTRRRPHAEKRGGFVSGEIQKKSSKMRTRKGDGVVSLSLENASSRISMNIEREVSRERRSAFF